MTDKRKYTRVTFPVPGTLTWNDKQFEVDLKDLSLRGAMVSGDMISMVRINDPVEMDIRSESLRIIVNGTPVSRGPEGLGLKWTSIGEKSLNNLYLAVKGCVADKAVIDKEFRGMILKPIQ